MNYFQRKVSKKALKPFFDVMKKYDFKVLTVETSDGVYEMTEQGNKFLDEIRKVNLRKEFMKVRKELKIELKNK